MAWTVGHVIFKTDDLSDDTRTPESESRRSIDNNIAAVTNLMHCSEEDREELFGTCLEVRRLYNCIAYHRQYWRSLRPKVFFSCTKRANGREAVPTRGVQIPLR
jgi:hypothetical protein